MLEILNFLQNKIIEAYPHLGNGELRKCTYAYFSWIFTTIMWISITFISVMLVFAIFNRWLNYKFSDKYAARKFWEALFNKI